MLRKSGLPVAGTAKERGWRGIILRGVHVENARNRAECFKCDRNEMQVNVPGGVAVFGEDCVAFPLLGRLNCRKISDLYNRNNHFFWRRVES